MPPSSTQVKLPLVLVVDDVEDHRFIYAEMLRYEGFRVAEAANGEEALAVAREIVPAVVIMDMSLPVLDGFEATRALRQDPRTRRVKIIGLSGRAEREARERASDAGCDIYVTKPCTPGHVVGHVRKLLGLAKKKPARSSSR